MPCSLPSALAYRLVGDPIDAVTGASTNLERDFRLPGPVPFDWRRYTNSSRAHACGALGWGHTHEYERVLRFDLDGLRYEGPSGDATNFPSLASDGASAVAGGLTLQRVSALRYELIAAGEPTMEFAFADPERPARLAALVHGSSRLTFWYRADDALSTIVLPDGRIIQAECDRLRRVCALVLVDDSGSARELVRYQYDEAGDLVAGVDAYHNQFSYAYDAAHRIVRRTDRRGYTFLFAFDALGRCIASEGEDGLYAVRLAYQPDERHTLVTQADGGEWTYWYDNWELLTAIVDPYGGARVFRYDDAGRVSEEVDAGGDATRWLYNASGRFVGRCSSLGHVVPAGEPVFRPDQRAHRVPSCPAEWEWGDLPAQARRALAPVYDEAGLARTVRELVTLVRDVRHGPAAPTARALRVECDTLGTKLREIAPDARARHWGYDAGGNTLRYHDFDGSVVHCEYASYDLPVRRTDPIGRTLLRQYTPTARVAQVVDPAGVRIQYVYDLKGRVAEFWYGNVCAERYQYDGADNLLATLDGAGRLIAAQEFGEKNLRATRRLAAIESAAGDCIPGETHRFTYTDRGEYASIATDTLEVTFTYDAFGQRTLDARDGQGVAHRFDGLGRLAHTTVLDRFTTCYHRAVDGTMEITDPGGGVHRVQCLEDGIVLRRMSSGLVEAARYADPGRCLARASTRAHASAPPWVRCYGYSGEADLLEVQDSSAGITRYAYDAAHRLTGSTAPDGTTVTFVHDAGDNLVEQPGLTSVLFAGGHRLWSANGDTFAYDARGNVAERVRGGTVVRYRHDARNRLVVCDTPAGEWTASYDPLGRRVRAGVGGVGRTFYWDTDRLAAELRDDGQLRVYVYADAFAIVPLLWLDYDAADADPSSARRYFVLCDHRGTPARVEDERGVTVWQADVAPYGAAAIRGVARVEMPLRFPGHYYDAQTGLHYNRFRYYSPELGRYLEPDPLRTVSEANWYAYSTNPLREIDVRGDCPVDGTTDGKPASTTDGDPAGEPDPAGGPPAGPAPGESLAAYTRRMADVARARNPRPAMVAGMETPDGTRSSAASSKSPRETPPDLPPQTAAAWDAVPPSVRTDQCGKCAEPAAVGNYERENGTLPPPGTQFSSAQVRGENSPTHGQPRPACQNCTWVMQQNGWESQSGYTAPPAPPPTTDTSSSE